MARPLRVNRPDGWYHAYGRGLNRMELYLDDGDRDHFLELLEEVVGRYRVQVHAYVLMGNHFHVAVRTPDANLSRAMQWLSLSYAAWFNARHRRRGPVFQRPFGSVPVQDPAWIYELSLYIHLNPLGTGDERQTRTALPDRHRGGLLGRRRGPRRTLGTDRGSTQGPGQGSGDVVGPSLHRFDAARDRASHGGQRPCRRGHGDPPFRPTLTRR